MKQITKIIYLGFLIIPTINKNIKSMKKIFQTKKDKFNFYIKKIKKLSNDPLERENARNILCAMEQLDENKKTFFQELYMNNQNSLVRLHVRKKINNLYFYGQEESKYFYDKKEYKKQLPGLLQFKKKIEEFIQEFTYTNTKDSDYSKRVGEHMYLELRRMFYSEINIARQITPIICALIRSPRFIKKLKKNSI